MRKNFIDLTRKEFGRLVAIEIVGYGKQGSPVWLCKCTCGKEIRVLGKHLRNGHTKSCGCYKRDFASIEKGLSAKRRVYRQYKANSRYRKILFELSFEQFLDLSQRSCYYCGTQPLSIMATNNGEFIYNGIDRVDNTKGYYIENCVSCCKKCNRAKDTMSYDEFIKWIKKVFNLYQEKITC